MTFSPSFLLWQTNCSKRSFTFPSLLLIGFLSTVSSPPQAMGLVDMKSGNFSETFIDAELIGPAQSIFVSRTYNSRTVYSGLFGFGWCTDSETQLEKIPEGLKIQQCGAGQEVIYRAEANPETMAKSIDQIIAHFKKITPNAPKDTVETLRQQLRDSASLRLMWAKDAKIPLPDPQKGTTFVSDILSSDRIEFNGREYTRTDSDGTVYKFDGQGRLIFRSDKNGNWLKYVFNQAGLKEIVDNSGRKLTFTLSPSKRVKSVKGPAGLQLEYKYEGEDLVEVKNQWKNTYVFRYDSNHNLVRIDYPDKSFRTITYNQKSDWAISHTERKLGADPACTEKYGYFTDKDDPKDHFWSTVERTCGKEVVKNAKFEFWLKPRSDGKRVLHRYMQTSEGESLDITYHPLFGKPVSVRQNGITTTFDYYPSGQVYTKSTATMKLTYNYKPETRRLEKVTTEFINEKGKVVKKRDTTFSFNEKGNLIAAVNSDGFSVKLNYDSRGRIAGLIDQAKKEVKLKYDDRTGRPTVITRTDLGTIAVTYKPDGQIDKVKSDDGPVVASQVAAAFNNYLDIISPATNELSL